MGKTLSQMLAEQLRDVETTDDELLLLCLEVKEVIGQDKSEVANG